MEVLVRPGERRGEEGDDGDRPGEPDRDAVDVRAVLGGDQAAFERIVRRWQRPLVNLAFRFCRDRGRAEELAQDVFVKVFRALERYREGSRFSTWLFAIATNHYRSNARRWLPARIPLEAISEVQDPRATHGLLEEIDRNEIVRRAVSSLPARYRDAVLLFYFFDMNLAAASGALGIPEGTVKARLHRGRNMLRKKLGRVLMLQPSAERV